MRALLLCLLLAACGAPFHRFPLADPMTVDPDRVPFRGEPEEYWSGLAWDGADQMVFRPVSRFLAVVPDSEAVNVNALDEVPDSSWFENRMGARRLSPQEVALGACSGPTLDPARGPWIVTGGKPNGENPGFLIEAPDGTRYLLKFDGTQQPERATAADVIGSRLYHAAGYFTPCNRIVFFDRSILRIAEDAEADDPDGNEEPMAERHLDSILERAVRLPDGRYRAHASRFVDGRPIGPWRYEGTRDDDPNDVVDHEDRRELRGMFLLAAWINHFDSREQNTIATWREVEDGAGWVQHYLLDWADSLGSTWDSVAMSRRLGHSSYLDFGHVVTDFVSLGAIRRPWDDPASSSVGPAFGYFDVERFDPEEWHPGYPNPAFLRAEESDLAWMARIIARFDRAHVEAAVAEASLESASTSARLTAVLEGRRRKILERYLARLSPLADASIDADRGRLCVRDLAVDARVVDRSVRTYGARAFVGPELAPRELGRVAREPDGSLCVALPGGPETSRSTPEYLVVDITASGLVLRVHLYRLGAGEHRLVGIERPASYEAPGS